MNLTRLRGAIEFWDTFAPWYEKWLLRGSYHTPVIRELSKMIEPGWRVLDIGAGTGVLSIPMSSLGCTVDALEPSRGMRAIFGDKLSSLGVLSVTTLRERWEDFDSAQEQPFDLIVACNSLHLTRGGIMGGMKKVFSARPTFICLATEINQDIFVDFKEVNRLQDSYTFLSIMTYRTDSSFHFEDMDEVAKLGKFAGIPIRVEMTEGRLLQSDSTEIAVLWWERRD
jgi:SAM-dependent methyltransferase